MSLKDFLSKFDKEHDYYELSVSINGDSRVYDPLQRPANSVISREFEETGMGRINLPFPVLTLVGRTQVLDKYKNIKWIDPTVFNTEEYDTTDHIKVPFCSGYKVSSSASVMMPITAKANRIIQEIEQLDTDEKNPASLQQAIWLYYEEIASTLNTQSGLIRGEVYETRMRNSMRAVCVPDTSLKFNQVGISKRHKSLVGRVDKKLYNVIYGIVDREPNLWEGSVQCLEVVLMDDDHDSIMLNPISHPGLGADFDGDCVSLVIPPHNKLTYPELQKFCGKTASEFSDWKEEFKLCSQDPDLDKYHQESMKYTLSPSDLLTTNGAYFDACRETGAKRIPDDLTEYANGIDINRFCEVSEETSLQLTRMKREIGLVGALTDKINQLLFALAPQLLHQGFRLKEKITQLLLDSKSGTDAFDSRELFDLFNKRGRFTKVTKKEFLQVLVDMGFTKDMIHWVVNILYVIWDILPLNVGVSSYLPQYQVSRSNNLGSLLAITRFDTTNKCVVDKVMSYMAETKP